MERQDVVIFGLIIVAGLVVTVMNTQFSNYAILISITMCGVFIYLRIKEQSQGFDFIPYDEILMKKFMDTSNKTNRGEIREIYLTGEEVFPYKKIGKCAGFFSYSLDVYPNEFENVLINGKASKKEVLNPSKREELEIFTLWYLEYSQNVIKKVIQHVIPFIDFLDVIKCVPVINRLCYPDIKGIVVNQNIVLFKSGVAEIRGKSLIPFNAGRTNLLSLIEYKGKSNEMRLAERFIFDKELWSDEFNRTLINIKNSNDISAKINPKVKVENELKLIKTG